ncbi:HNH endonuclease [Brevundimonas sp. TWP2-3-4b1]|uniref:HNH endonuclease n=1 Tax=Brevundimonas sp. TWP2-3-4b1 TaxID=2804580 RepID=UPI003CE8D92E
MAITKVMRNRVFVRDGLICRYCRRRCTVLTNPAHQPPETATVDHLDPAAGDAEDNLATACKSCNSRKNRKTVDEFERWICRNDPEETRI